MIVDVRTDGSVALLEAEDMRAFKLVAPIAMSDADLARSLKGAADVSAGHAWVSQSWIRAHAPLAAQGEWQASFAKMVAYAGTKGWLRETDAAIRAHIERK